MDENEEADTSNEPVEEPMEEEDASPQKLYDWSAFYDSDARIYYYNNATGESSWEAPEKFNPPPEEEVVDDQGEAAEAVEEGQEIEQATKQVDTETAGTTELAKGTEEKLEETEAGGPWVAYQDDQGQEYYYNNETGETQWEKPAELLSAAPSRDGEQESTSPQKPASPTGDETVDAEKLKAEEEREEPEEEKDPAVKRLEDAEKALSEPDAIMEPGCLSAVGELVTGLGGNEGGKKAIELLTASFQGAAAQCGVLSLWLADLKTAGPYSNNNQRQTSFNKATDDVRDIVTDVIYKIAKERFTKTGGDNILNLSKSEAAFLEEMMDSNRWRKLLIDLSASHKDSALLMYCLQSISKRGHHREIARRINQSDHFAVYNAMLTSEFAVVGKAAVSAHSNADGCMDMNALVADLRRTCTATSYTYLYAIEVLRELLSSAKCVKALEEAAVPRFHRATRKWERLREELESAMVDPSTSAETTGSSPLFRKRRLDIALTISDLYQRQRRRRKPSSDEVVEEANGDDNKHHDSMESALLTLLKRHSLGIRLDDRLLDQLLQHETNLSSNGEVGRLLISHPLSVKVLLGHLFKPGASRIGSVETKRKCARLVALAVVSAEQVAVNEAKRQMKDTMDLSVSADEVSNANMLLTGSQLCEQVENMVSFTVTADAGDIGGPGSSAGRRLSSLAMKSASVAQGVVMWATDIAMGPEFVTSPSYPTLTPSILSLLRLISLRHPFTRPAVRDVAFMFLVHANPEISFQKMNAIKEQCLRLLLFLVVNGEVTTVLGEISTRLRQKGNSEIGASLVRYFVGGLLDVLRPPYSLPLVRSLAHLLSSPRCVDALRSSYFDNANKNQLKGLLADFSETLSDHGAAPSSGCTQEDSTLVSSLISDYK